MKVILSGGGTGGHIYPAVAVAGELRRMGVEVLFVGAEGRMEMEKVPALGWRIVGLPTAGLQRGRVMKNLGLPVKVWRSVRMAKKVLKEFGADVVVGFGGYASGPVLWAAQGMGVPTVIQEQNSFAGITNRLLGRRAGRICVAYDGMERFFPAAKIEKTGNPLRSGFADGVARDEALGYFGLRADRPVVLVLGGSLGTRTLNEMVKKRIAGGLGEVQVIWQTGRYYEREIDAFWAKQVENQDHTRVWKGAFIERMDYAYAAADVVISRSGANTVSELQLAGKPVVFVPSPNVAEDHQTKNAQALVDVGAAEMVRDADAVARGFEVAGLLLGDDARRALLARNIRQLARPDAARRIAEMVIEMGAAAGVR